MRRGKRLLALLFAAAVLVLTGENPGLLTAYAENTEEEAVATVGDTEYTASQFQAAMAASTKENPVVVQKDFVIPDTINFNYDSGVDAYVDLNGKTVGYRGENRLAAYASDSGLHLYSTGETGTLTHLEEDNAYLCFSTLSVENVTTNFGILYEKNCVLKDAAFTGSHGIRQEMFTEGEPLLTVQGKVTVQAGIEVSRLLVEEAATLDTERYLYISEGMSRLNQESYNYGTVIVDSDFILSNDWSTFYNYGTLDVGYFKSEISSLDNAGNLVVNKSFYMGQNVVSTNSGTITIISKESDTIGDPGATLNNTGAIYIYPGKTNQLTVNNSDGGSIRTAVLIDTVSAEVAAPTAGSAFPLTAISGDEENYSASVAYYKDGTPVDSDSADYNTVYTAEVTLTPTEGCAFLIPPTTATVNGAELDCPPTLGKNGTVLLTYTFPNATAKLKLTGIQTPAAIAEVPYGTEKTAAALGLPETVTITTEQGNQTAAVTWNVADCSYDTALTTAQTFTVTGTVALPDGLDANGISTETAITVPVAGAPSKEESTTKPTEDQTKAPAGEETQLTPQPTEAQAAVSPAPQTGDAAEGTAWTVLFGSSLAGAAVLFLVRKKSC